MRNLLMLTIGCLLAPALPARAQQAPTPAAAVKAGFEEVAGWLAKAADMVPAEKYAYKPVGTVRSFGEVLAHAADGMNWYCGSAKAGKDLQWSDAVEKAGAGKAPVVAALKKATADCGVAYASSSPQYAKLMGNVAHLNLHYGNVITYMRMMGLKPPSS